ncbi:DUF4351 domain-containing protein [Tychonema sp. BBK16]|uniref:DUF4351 domain-containing protein n=1 Tax=Tychonema sp. BBK16 TaxID=2699888 RepID=UPI001F37C40A|nr:DUF4351 domain-containing protein [Tychonema sp. BBK16]MCF6371889.1 DUF4351 domain-containing protein [Tychonema sp. BBK16]
MPSRRYSVILRQLTRLIGSEFSADIQRRIQELNRNILEDLGEEMFDFGSSSDLVTWLQQHSRNFTNDI